MRRRRMTERFPWLLPFRKRQRAFCFYAGMALDRNTYAKTTAKEPLAWAQYGTFSPLYNEDTGFDLQYQENKVFNLRLAARKLDGLLLRPGETFSFWRSVRHADREIPYKDGLTVVNGKMTAAPGGGLCQMSNLLFALFLHSPLTILERSGHRRKEFADPGTSLAGVDATVSEGWADLKVRNDTDRVFQIKLAFDSRRIYGILRTDREPDTYYRIENENLAYWRKGGRIYQTVSVCRQLADKDGAARGGRRTLHENQCEIAYALPAGVEIKEEIEHAKKTDRNSFWRKLFGV